MYLGTSHPEINATLFNLEQDKSDSFCDKDAKKRLQERAKFSNQYCYKFKKSGYKAMR